MTISTENLQHFSNQLTCAIISGLALGTETPALMVFTFRNDHAQSYVFIPEFLAPDEILEPVGSLARELCAAAVVLVVHSEQEDEAHVVRSASYAGGRLVDTGLAVIRAADSPEADSDSARGLALIPGWTEMVCKSPYACLGEATSRAKAGKTPGSPRWYRRAAQRLTDEFCCYVRIADDEIYPMKSEIRSVLDYAYLGA